MEKQKIDLDGKTWLQNSVSIWSDIKKSRQENNLDHPAIFPLMLPERLISIFSHTEDIIFDPFAGTGTTLIAAKNSKRYGVGTEISDEYINSYNRRINNLSLFDEKKYEPKMIKDDANNILNYLDQNSVQLTITSPPYWDILNQKRTADNKDVRNYDELDNNLGAISSYNEFLNALQIIFEKVYDITKQDGFCCVVLMDLRKRNKFYPFHVDTIQFMEKIGFELDDIIIWDRRHEYNNLRPLGYPYVFRVNKVHEFILIFQK